MTDNLHPVRISSATRNAIRSWSSNYNGYSSCASSFQDMVEMAQSMTAGLRQGDSLEIIEDRGSLRQSLAGSTEEAVVCQDFMSFLYRDAKGLSVFKPSGDVCEQRPFEHEDVFMLPSKQFAFLQTARANAVAFGAAPELTVHDVAAAIVENLQQVAADGKRYFEAGQEFKIRRAAPANT